MPQTLNRSALTPTDLVGLDHIFLGGVRKGNAVLIDGVPGAGKSTLCLQIIYNAALRGENSWLISFEKSADKIVQDALNFGWKKEVLDHPRIRILQCSPQEIFDEFLSTGGSLFQDLAQSAVKVVVIDGLGPLRLLCERSPVANYRQFLGSFIRMLNELGITSFLTTEVCACGSPAAESTDIEIEHYVADTLITLRREAIRRNVRRSLEISKSRGQDFIAGRHNFVIRSGLGLRVFPRIHAQPQGRRHALTSSERITTGCSGLDDMLDGGTLRGSTTLVSGASGTGKTVLSMQFLSSGAEAGERGLLVSLDEHPEQILRNAASLGLNLQDAHERGDLIIHYDSPLEVDLDEHFYTIKDLVETQNISRVVIDSVASYQYLLAEDTWEFCVSLVHFLKSRLITTFLNFEGREILGVSSMGDHLKTSTIADNIILLSYIEISTMMRRALTVPKSRGSSPSQRTREYLVKKGGLVVLDDDSVEGIEAVPQLPLSSYYGVLARAPARHSPLIDEYIAGGKPLPKSQVPKSKLAPKKVPKTRKDKPS